jgi:hypothetical protein
MFSKTNTILLQKIGKSLYVIYANKDLLLEKIEEIGKKIKEKLSEYYQNYFWSSK